MSDMVERVARAIVEGCKASDKDGAFIQVNDYAGTVSIDGHFDINAVARTVIETILAELEKQRRYSTPVYDDVGMQDDENGDWIRLSEIDAALTTSRTE